MPRPSYDNDMYRSAQYILYRNKSQDRYDDDINDYSSNVYGHRTEELTGKKDLVFSGCSFTFGIGVPSNGIWSHFVSENLAIDSHNIGGAGKSVSWIVSNLMAYFNIYGNPKTLMCLFPNFTRMEMYSNSSHMKARRYFTPSSVAEDTFHKYGIDIWVPEEQPKFSKRPHVAEDVIPKELAINISLESIKMLEMYCDRAGIEFIWATWSAHENDFFANPSNSDFKNFLHIDDDSWHSNPVDNFYDRYHKYSEICNYNTKCSVYIDCHKEYRDIYGENFDLASDINSARASHHWGVHRHIHIAEDFIKAYNERYPRN